MSKRSITETVTATNYGQAYNKITGGGSKREVAATDEMGEFEDPWEDEIQSEEEEEAQGEDDNDMDIDQPLPAIEESEEQTAPTTEVFIPGTHKLEADEVLEPDESVYLMRHQMSVTWPSLSFDILRDDLGDERQRFPATAYLVTGTQTGTMKDNEVVVYKITHLHKTQRNNNSDSEDEDDEDDTNNLDEDPALEYRSIPHIGGVNRIRVQPLPPSTPLPDISSPYYAASWSETGKVHVWDIRPLIESLTSPGYSYDKKRTHTPACTIDSHGRVEGFALDWASSGSSSLRLLTGDIHSKIYLTTSTPSGFKPLTQPFLSHTSSIEDLQWSPTEPTVFASCSADQSIRIWDVRSKGRQSVAGIVEAHPSDVNVISWNKSSTYLLLSGGDEGGIKVWDLRNVSKTSSLNDIPAPVASFAWHKNPITSIEWHPTDESTFVASSDDQVSLWDLSVEPDDDEMGDVSSGPGQQVPPQLLFTHMGQSQIKEAHWHPQIPGMVVSTAFEGFSFFKTISV